MRRYDVLTAGELGHDVEVAGKRGAQMRLKLWNTRCVPTTSVAAIVANISAIRSRMFVEDSLDDNIAPLQHIDVHVTARRVGV